mmetsp:Transcript_9867/g.8714  ORF Transcript_9867/g.8714 Transcript_9867/m.8714 type:complete len:81 (-) Transcript_9867:135-377(-)
MRHMKFISKVLLDDDQRLYIENYDPDKIIRPDTLEPSYVRQISMGENLAQQMPANLSSDKQKTNFTNLIDKFVIHAEEKE